MKWEGAMGAPIKGSAYEWVGVMGQVGSRTGTRLGCRSNQTNRKLGTRAEWVHLKSG